MRHVNLREAISTIVLPHVRDLPSFGWPRVLEVSRTTPETASYLCKRFFEDFRTRRKQLRQLSQRVLILAVPPEQAQVGNKCVQNRAGLARSSSACLPQRAYLLRRAWTALDSPCGTSSPVAAGGSAGTHCWPLQKSSTGNTQSCRKGLARPSPPGPPRLSAAASQPARLAT